MNLKGSKSRHGFMLLEVLISLSILSIGLLVLIRGFSSALRTIKTSSRITTAILLAEDKISQISSGRVSLSEPSSGDLGPQMPGYTYKIDMETVPEPEWKEKEDMSRESSLFKTDVLPGDNKDWLNKVTVTISWQHDNQPRDINLSTYFAAREKDEEDQ